MATKKETKIELTDMWKGILTSRQHELADGEAAIYEEIPMSVEEFVTEMLGIKPQRGAIDVSLTAPSVLSDQQKEFIETATDFDNQVTNFVLWVG